MCNANSFPVIVPSAFCFRSPSLAQPSLRLERRRYDVCKERQQEVSRKVCRGMYALHRMKKKRRESNLPTAILNGERTVSSATHVHVHVTLPEQGMRMSVYLPRLNGLFVAILALFAGLGLARSPEEASYKHQQGKKLETAESLAERIDAESRLISTKQFSVLCGRT